MASQAEDLADFAEKAEALVRQTFSIPGVDAVRVALREAGIVAARRRLDESLGHLDGAQADFRNAQAAERDAKETYESALTEAEWELGDRFVTESNKTYLVLTDSERRQMTADERKAWIAAEAKKVAEVKASAVAHYRAEQNTAAMRDAVTIADKGLSAARADLDAAVATLQAWTAVLPRRGAA